MRREGMRILFLTHRFPYPPDRGDRIRAYQLLRQLASFATVDLVSLVHSADEARGANELAPFCASITTAPVRRLSRYAAAAGALIAGRPLTHALLDSAEIRPQLEQLAAANRPDVVVAYCSGMAQFALEQPLRDIPMVMDLVDVDSAKWAALGAIDKSVKGFIYRREARALSAFESRAANAARTTLVVNARELEAIRKLAPSADLQVVSNGIDAAFFAPRHPPAITAEVVFCGVMNYQPNVDGAIWLMEQVWPLVRAKTSASLAIVGSDPTSAVKQLAAKDPTITVTGRVPDVRPYLWRAALSVAPLLTARGVQNKVLEATAAGLPSVVTPAVFDGLPGEVRAACTVADSPELFAAGILRLLDASPSERRTIAARADLSCIGWGRALASLPAILETARRR